MESSGTAPLVTRAICSRGALYVGCIGPSIVKGSTTVGILVNTILGILAWLVARSCLMQRLPAHW